MTGIGHRECGGARKTDTQGGVGRDLEGLRSIFGLGWLERHYLARSPAKKEGQLVLLGLR